MSGRGHRASLPPAGHRAVLPLGSDGLVVTVVNLDGRTKQFDFSTLALPEAMQRSLAAAFAAQSRGWSGHASAQAYWGHLRIFATFLNTLAPVPEDLDGLTVAMLKRWRARNSGTVAGARTLTAVRALLRRDGRIGAGPAGEEFARRVVLPASRKQVQAFGSTERERVVLAAQRQFRSALLRVRENTQVLELWRAGRLEHGCRQWQIGRILDHVARTADVPRLVSSSGHERVADARLLGGAAEELTWGRLFLTRGELTALAVLLTDRFGWNLSLYNRMPAPCPVPSAGDRHAVTYLVEIEKARAGAGRWFSSENITDSGADTPGRLITHALEATAHGRALAARLEPGTDLLMVARSSGRKRDHQDTERPRPVGRLSLGLSTGDVKLWVDKHGLNGSPFQQIRRGTVISEGRPLQHTRATHESVYVLPNQTVQDASRQVFEDGANDALDLARRTVFAGQLAEEPHPAGQETATADCTDAAASPWPAPEGGCAADFLLCLACPNAHVHPGHHPRLALLHEQLQSLRSAVPEPMWAKHWHGHLLRLQDLRDRIGTTAWNVARNRAGDQDRAVADLLLKGELAP